MILSPIGNSQVYNVDGTLIVGGKIWSYQAETTTPTITYSDRGGTVQHTNPIILNQYGLPDEPIWIQEGRKYKFVFMDEDDNLLWTYDNISGINDFTIGGGTGGEEEEVNNEWIEGDIGVFQSANSFYINGDRTKVYHKFRRVKLQMAVNFVYGFISESIYNADLDRTEIKVVLDDNAVINEFLSNTYYSILSYSPQSYPNFLPMAQWQKRGNDLVIQSGYINVWEHSGNFAHVTGTGDVIAMGKSLQEGASKYLLFQDIGSVIINNANIKTPQGVPLQVLQGDIIEVFAGEGGVNLVTHLMSNKATEIATWDSPLQTRQTILTGPYQTQNNSVTVAPYYEVPPMALPSNNSFGYIVTSSGTYPGHSPVNAWVVFNKVGSYGVTGSYEMYNGSYVQIEFPEPFYINYVYFNGPQHTKDIDEVYFYASMDGVNFTYVTGVGGSNGKGPELAWNVPLTLTKFMRCVGYDYYSGVFGVHEIKYNGYKSSDIVTPTVSTQVESLIKKTDYTQISPTMSASAQAGYTVTASSEKGTASAWKAFDGTAGTFWESTGATNEWLKMAFPLAVTINRVKLSSSGSLPTEMPERWVIQGSNDNTAWTDIKEWMDTETWIVNETYYFDFINTTAYTFYRLFVKTNQGGASIMIAECALLSIVPTSIQGSAELNLTEVQSVVTIADGFTTRGQNDYTIALPIENKFVEITKGATNYIYLRRNPLSSEISYESKQFAPVYGKYQPEYIVDIPVLLRGDNTTTISTIVDAYGNKSITTQGTVTVSTIAKKFGAGSLLFSSAGAKVKIPRNMGITQARWSIDFWWNPQSLTGIVDLVTATPNLSMILAYGRVATKLSLHISSNGTSWNVATASPGLKTNFAINTWYYINFIFTGNRYVVYVDGVQDIEVSSSLQMWQIYSLDIGSYLAETNTAPGYIDEFRFRPNMVNYYNELTPILPTETAVYQKPWFFNITQMKGYEVEEDGNLTSVQMLSLGEAYVKDTSSYNATTITYAYNGRKNIQWSEFNPIVDAWIDLPHNIGTDLIVSSVNLNSKTAAAPYSNQAIIPIEAVGMYGGAATWGGIPMGKVVDRTLLRIRYPAQSSADYVAAYGGSALLSSISGDAISVSGTFMRAF